MALPFLLIGNLLARVSGRQRSVSSSSPSASTSSSPSNRRRSDSQHQDQKQNPGLPFSRTISSSNTSAQNDLQEDEESKIGFLPRSEESREELKSEGRAEERVDVRGGKAKPPRIRVVLDGLEEGGDRKDGVGVEETAGKGIGRRTLTWDPNIDEKTEGGGSSRPSDSDSGSGKGLSSTR